MSLTEAHKRNLRKAHTEENMRKAFTEDEARDSLIIAQSNMRSAAISQLLAAVWGFSGIVAVFIMAKPGVHMTPVSLVFGLIAGALFVVQLFAKAAILWPRGLGNLPRDRDEDAYKLRLAQNAAAMAANPHTIAEREFQEGFLLQRIRATKELYTRITLAAVVLYLPCGIIFLLTLKY